jgi:hypothetical protein
MARRTWLRLAVLGGLGWNVQDKRARAAPAGRESPPSPKAAGFGQARSVVVVFANGGQSQIDTWDPKPQAPEDIRGVFRPIRTAVPGVHVCEHLPQVARLADRLTIIRSMSHEDLDHGSAAYLCLTGVYHPRRSANPPPSPSDVPTLGAVVRRLRRDRSFLADAVHLNGPALVPVNLAPGQDGGLLGRAWEPLLVGDPAEAAKQLGNLALPDELPPLRLQERLSLKQTLDRHLLALERYVPAQDLARLYAQGCAFLLRPQTRQAFHLEAEPESVRRRYGLFRSGQALLLARRLVEAGVPYINVIWNHSNRGQDQDPADPDRYGWDTHNDIFEALGKYLLPRFDQSFSALIEDLEQRGLLDQTLVVCMGEFGRAPRVALEPRFAGSSPGRKHWASVYSIVVAGAGVQRGAVLGASDRWGAEPAGERYGPWDVAATIFHALGIDPAGHYPDLTGRPMPISHGRPIAALYGS